MIRDINFKKNQIKIKGRVSAPLSLRLAFFPGNDFCRVPTGIAF
jgi:hypothetical protein